MKKKNKKFKQYEKLLRKDEDFDFGFLLELERFKLKRMVKSFEEASHPHVGIEYTIRDLKMCVKLLDIIMEDDAVSKMYNEASVTVITEHHKLYPAALAFGRVLEVYIFEITPLIPFRMKIPA